MEALKEKSGLRFWRGRRDRRLSRKKIADAADTTRADGDVISMIMGGSEVVSHQNYKGEGVRVKVLVKKENLEKVLEFMRANLENSGDISSISPSSLYLEECINAMKRRRRISRTNLAKSSSCHANSSWRPALHSIPE